MLRAEKVEEVRGQRGFVVAERAGRLVGCHQRRERLPEGLEVEVADTRLLVVGVEARLVGVVADVAGLEVVEEPERPVVHREAEDGEVVGVHHAVAEADGLPFRHELARAADDFLEPPVVFVLRRDVDELGVVLRDDVVGEGAEVLHLFAVVEDLEAAEAHMARGHAQDHRARLGRFAEDRFIAADEAERARGGNAQPVQGFAAKVFADRGTKHGAAVAEAGEGGLARALEVEIPLVGHEVEVAVVEALQRGTHFTQQDRSTVAELRHVAAELVSGVEHRQRIAPGNRLPAGDEVHEVRPLRFGGIEVDEVAGGLVEVDEPGILERLRLDALVERVREPRVGVVEGQLLDRSHPAKLGTA